MKGVCNDKKISRGEIYVADLNPYQGSEQGGIRPVVILQNDAGNYFSSTTIVALLTSHVAKKENLQYKISTIELKDAHPNTALLELTGENGRELKIVASSLGGGRISVEKIDDIETHFTGEYPTLIVHNLDQPGHVAEVASMLSHKSINIATLNLYRDKRGGYAVMVVETDQTIPEDSIKWLEHLEGVIKVTYLDITGGGKNVL